MKLATIYTLTDPNTMKVYYVGCTAQPLAHRLKIGHNIPTSIKLKAEGKQPIIEPVETLVDREAKYAEVFWMEQFTAWGFVLENKLRHATYKWECPTVAAKKAQLIEMLAPFRGLSRKEKVAAAHAIGMSYVTLDRYLKGKIFRIVVAQVMVKYFTIKTAA